MFVGSRFRCFGAGGLEVGPKGVESRMNACLLGQMVHSRACPLIKMRHRDHTDWLVHRGWGTSGKGPVTTRMTLRDSIGG